MPDELIAVANQGEFDEFDLNEFFDAKGIGKDAEFTHKTDVQKWLCLLYTSDAADERSSVDLGGRRIIKKKKRQKTREKKKMQIKIPNTHSIQHKACNTTSS